MNEYGKYGGCKIPKELQKDALKGIYKKTEFASYEFACNLSKGTVGCPSKGCTNCILYDKNKKIFFEYMEDKPLRTNNIKGEDKMNKNIVKVFEKTADAVLVEKYLTDEVKELVFMEKNKPAILKACIDAKNEAESNKD